MALFDIILHTNNGFEGSAEFALGMQELRRRLPSVRRWYVVNDGDATKPTDFAAWSDASFLLVILNPALLVSDNLQDELLAVGASDSTVLCVLPSDVRGFTPGVFLDYASRPGFDRFVSRLSIGQRSVPYDGREPWLYLVARKALDRSDLAGVSWEELPTLLREQTVIAGHAYLHSYANYYFSNRAEILPLLPVGIGTLLDIGGGEGNFGRLFMDERGGQATLLEPNPEMAAAARLKGLEVLVGDFQQVTLPQRYDCVTFLDVLEHIADPFEALLKARQALKPGGCIVLSVPNVGHWSVVWDLLEGSFDYQPVGILCNTHLRFFSRHGLEKLLADTGFCVERWENVASPLPETFSLFLESRAVAGITLDLESLATAHFHVLARCPGEITQ